MNKDFEETLASAKRDLEKNEAVHRSKPAGRRSVHTAVASGHGCGAQRPLCGLTATPI